jgi:CBS domain-containing protein
MKVQDVMSREVVACSVDDTLSVPAQMMWDRTVGSVVVLSGDQLSGIITDRDIAMSAQTQGRSLGEISVRTAMTGEVVACGPDERLSDVVKRMVQRRVRRCPVVDSDAKVVGLLSLDDLAELTAHRRLPGTGPGISQHDVLSAYAATAVAPIGAQPSPDTRAVAAALAGQLEARARRAWSQVRRTWSELEQDVPGRNRAARIGSRLVRALPVPGVIRRHKDEAGSGTNGQQPPHTRS